MRSLAILIAFILSAVLIPTQCAAGTSSRWVTGGSESSTLSSPWPTTSNLSSSSSHYSYYYMDDSSIQCGPPSYNYLEKRSNVAYVKAWGSTPRTTTRDSCDLTFAAYGADGIKYSFLNSYNNYIDDCSVNLYVYSGTSSLYTSLVAKYNCLNITLPTYDKYVSSGDVTFKLVNNGRSTNFDFKIKVTSYDRFHDAANAGIIIGVTLGCFLLLVLIVVMVCVRARRRRLFRQRNALIPAATTVVAGYAPATYGSNYQHVPPPPPGTYQAYPTPPPYYQQPPPPAGAVSSQPPPPMPVPSQPESGYTEKTTAPAYGAV